MFSHIIFQASIRQLQIQQSPGQNDIVHHDVNKFPPFVRASTSFQTFYLYINHRYNNHLEDARVLGVKKGLINGVSLGIVWLVIMCTYGLGFWYGAKLTRDEPENYTVGKMTVVSLS